MWKQWIITVALALGLMACKQDAAEDPGLIDQGTATAEESSSEESNAEQETAKATPTPAPRPQSQTSSSSAQNDGRMQAQCANCGRVESVSPRSQKAQQGSGIGAVLGGAMGGVLGHQVGGGSGKKIATVVGAIGGAIAGNEIEKQQKAVMVDDVTIRMDQGGTQIVTLPQGHGLQAGQRVRVIGEDVAPL